MNSPIPFFSGAPPVERIKCGRNLNSTTSEPSCFHPAVSERGSFIRYWLPVILWMLLIFSASTDLLSSQRTSRFIGPFLRWLIPGITDATVRQVQFAVRKMAHLMEYAVLAVLVWRALQKPVEGDPRPWSWRVAAQAVSVCLLYAVTDELHQSFVLSRFASPWDVFIDTAGASAGVGIMWTARRWRGCR
jgi:VanZ family protein